MTGQSLANDVLGWACSADNQALILPALAFLLAGIASVLSGWQDRMPWWLGHVLNALGLNWGTFARMGFRKLDAILAAHYQAQAAAAGPSQPVPGTGGLPRSAVEMPLPAGAVVPQGSTASELNRSELDIVNRTQGGP